MIATDLKGVRLAELLIAELVGRDAGPLESITVPGVSGPTGVTGEVGETYDIAIDDRVVAILTVQETAVRIDREPGGPTIRIEDGATVKAGVDAIAAWVP